MPRLTTGGPANGTMRCEPRGGHARLPRNACACAPLKLSAAWAAGGGASGCPQDMLIIIRSTTSPWEPSWRRRPPTTRVRHPHLARPRRHSGAAPTHDAWRCMEMHGDAWGSRRGRPLRSRPAASTQPIHFISALKPSRRERGVNAAVCMLAICSRHQIGGRRAATMCWLGRWRCECRTKRSKPSVHGAYTLVGGRCDLRRWGAMKLLRMMVTHVVRRDTRVDPL